MHRAAATVADCSVIVVKVADVGFVKALVLGEQIVDGSIVVIESVLLNYIVAKKWKNECVLTVSGAFLNNDLHKATKNC
nr:unnamed protein product [Spirometra erinaceieuropaei]